MHCLPLLAAQYCYGSAALILVFNHLYIVESCILVSTIISVYISDYIHHYISDYIHNFL